ncbi:hypothetical protein Pmar_PMAR002976 [Perkinsus marinus ATCC 50983]|uniref:Uncharacterized protein n=1 Tax=Perkinsus marinus (strain ATCC 50983 / TXsc) TaxID=423536 RepID=C5LR21_PERM5|nr:hypothetical protein Pmar_PMAR002976 [Perkinsus marinus ATCC 50983]EER00906.1 hypothetical protein Pmar_PMAR002976 [Perkinsus marinus ATCC 50983]|eukprot:XP_002768188.1 hypothetical protein Pmar_PMAR002976 [Perkinsus marinus ATCC 50983]
MATKNTELCLIIDQNGARKSNGAGWVGHQRDSLKPTRPSYSFGLGTRGAREKLFISKEHEKLMPPRCSPGPVYRVESQIEDHSYTFSTAAQRPSQKKRYPDSSVDLTNALVDSQPLKYPTVKGTIFGTDPKGHIKNATILKNHASAFYGRISPGPTAYSPDDKQTSRTPRAPRAILGSKTKILASECQTPAVVGPGTYPSPTSMGTQHLSQKWDRAHRRNLSSYTFSKARRAGERSKKSSVDTMDRVDSTSRGAISSIGEQHDSRIATAPKFGFGTATRDHKAKTFLVRIPGDTGPSDSWAKPSVGCWTSHPNQRRFMAARATTPNPLLNDDNYDIELPPAIKGKVKILRICMGICAFMMLACKHLSSSAFSEFLTCKMHISHCAMYAVFAGLNAFFDFIELLLRAIGTDRKPSRLFATGVEVGQGLSSG